MYKLRSQGGMPVDWLRKNSKFVLGVLLALACVAVSVAMTSCAAQRLPEQKCFSGGTCVSWLADHRVFEGKVKDRDKVLIQWSFVLIPDAAQAKAQEVETMRIVHKMDLPIARKLVASMAEQGLPDGQPGEYRITGTVAADVEKEMKLALMRAGAPYHWEGSIRVAIKDRGPLNSASRKMVYRLSMK